MNATRARKPSMLAIVVAAIVITSSCGTRVSLDAIPQQPGAGALNTAETSSLDSGPSHVEMSAPRTESDAAPPKPERGVTVPSTQPAGGARAAGREPTGSVGGPPPAQGTQAGSKSVPGPGSGTPPGDATPAPVLGAKSVLKIGLVGHLSGPAGNSYGIPILQGIQLWVSSINSRGGLNGHRVDLIAADDGTDPARHRALVQQLVEERHVLAFVANPDAFSGEGTASYLEAKRIPNIGVTGAEPWAARNSMFFPQMSNGNSMISSFYGGFAQQGKARGLGKLGILYCVEAQLCRDANSHSDEAEALGMKVVYKSQVSLAQPDFTAECLSARNAGAEMLFLMADGNALRRLASSCTRQGFRPLFATGLQAVDDDMKNDANLNNTTISNAAVFPYFQDNTPATNEFQQAMKQFGKNLKPFGSRAIGWSAAKLLERAAVNVPEPPTTEAILRGLWSIKNDDLGGITQPLTFVESRPAAPKVCWWNMAIVDGAWASPDHFSRSCL